MNRLIGLEAATSQLAREIALNRRFEGLHETAFLALVITEQRLEELGRTFFPRFGLTEAQFNVLMVLHDYPGRPFRQHELAEILVVNRASIGAVLERMERDGLIEREPDAKDRRAMLVTLTRQGVAKIKEARPHYFRLMARLFKDEDERSLGDIVLACDRLRRRIAEAGGNLHLSDKE